MEKKLSNINIFNNSDFLNKNDRWNSNYIDLPFIMSTLNVNSTSSTSQEIINNSSENISDSENETPSTFTEEFTRRSTRLNKDNLLHRINRRTISKPKKLPIKEMNLTPKAIKKLYIESSKVVKNFRPTNLETIFEEPLEDMKNGCIKYLGNKKLKRSLSCSDGLNIKKTTIKSRRLKIKKTYGKRFALKKITFDDFHEKLNLSMEPDVIIPNKTVEFDNVNVCFQNINNNSLIITENPTT